MANSTGWGGRRPGAGRKKKNPGAAAVPVKKPVSRAPEPVKVTDLPPVAEYLKAEQVGGIPLRAEKIYIEVYSWLQARNCIEIVGGQLIEQYALNVARYLQCEEIVSRTGITAARGTGGTMINPYVTAGQEYLKTANNIWLTIMQTVKEVSGSEFKATNPEDNILKELLGV